MARGAFCGSAYNAAAGGREYPIACRHASLVAEKARKIEMLEEEIKWQQEHVKQAEKAQQEAAWKLEEETIRRQHYQALSESQLAMMTEMEEVIKRQQEAIDSIFLKSGGGSGKTPRGELARETDHIADTEATASAAAEELRKGGVGADDTIRGANDTVKRASGGEVDGRHRPRQVIETGAQDGLPPPEIKKNTTATFL
eukprot:TRINITY_DN51260_c0_g1_i1.p1 TRINITY_DN51260_c0_g1~~TRINITY_DN51260_c0_g1_i1.p1  ORF type:complete len:199 (-),score=54.11 TRINITY_DN51260_c0_g1_i1:148-744(-)